MAKQKRSKPAKPSSTPRIGPTPGSWKPGQSGNPNGRPRQGTALAERIRQGLDPDIIIELAKQVAEDKKLSPGVRLAALLPVFDRGYVRPPLHVEASQNVAITVGLEIDRIIGVLDADGLRCLEIVMLQLERAGVQALPAAQDSSPPVVGAEAVER